MEPIAEPYVHNLGIAYSEIAKQHGRRPAVRPPNGNVVTHDELHRLSNRMARALQELGVSPGDVVAVFHAKSVDAYASMLACLKLGAIYTNLDVTSPAERIAKMLQTCKPALVLGDGGGQKAGPPADVACKRFDDEDFRKLLEAMPSHDLDETAAVTGSDPSYIMFTSGSTGFPKGAIMTHANVLNFIEWARTTFEVTPGDVFTNVNPMYFDNSVFDFYASLFNGASLVPLGPALVKRPRDLVSAVGDHGCTIWFSVPSMLIYLLTMRAIEEDDFPRVRSIIFGGEGFPKPRLRDLHRLVGSRTKLVNVYGPTECTCICSAYDIRPADFDDLGELAPLGEMAPNFGYYIEPLDTADPNFGELLLYGANVGLGYLNDEERTDRSFVLDPRLPGFRRVMYRTGDLVQRATNGWLYFKGRADNQIKHMGYRIELEEIEAAFATLPYVREVAVVYRRVRTDSGEIVAYVATGGESTANEDKIVSDVKRLVPPYMVPRRIHRLNVLPKNANGKIDRKGLQEQAA